MSIQKRILIVDDEESIRAVIAEGLHMYGYYTQTAENPDVALAQLQTESFDLALVDLKMPGSMNGLQLLAEMRRRCPQMRTIVLTGYATLDSAIVALREGASDYIRKPAEIQEILTGVQRALAEKTKSAPSEKSADDPTRFLQTTRLFIDRYKHLAILDGKNLHLTPIEFAMLEYLVAHADRVISASELVRAAQNYDLHEADARSLIRVHIQHLREKLGDNGRNPRFILNLRGRGYRYVG
jgi:two-component system alkaline phosphatase synthesis response regulator PhoP